MKVDGTKDIQQIDRVAGREEHRAPAAATSGQAGDKVTIEGRHVAELLSSSRMRSDNARTGRLEQLESQIRAGTYRPDAGQLAEKLLSAAEVDARLRALLKG
jgi:anti-sigma28 factor (negative regulator of flagellin synthesis)